MPAVSDRKPEHPCFDFEEEELDPAIDELRPLCLKQRSDTLQWYRTLGKLVAKHYTRVEKEREKTNGTMYGQHFFERLAAAIQVVSAALLRSCFNLYYFYPEGPAFRDLASHKAISPTHALRLASISDGPVRQWACSSPAGPKAGVVFVLLPSRWVRAPQVQSDQHPLLVG
jgi:hypothetical protein